MVKPITTNTQNKASQTLGHEPIVVVEVDWGMSNTPQNVFRPVVGENIKRYAGKELNIGSIHCEPRLLEIGKISSVKKVDNVGSISVVSISLDDYDGALKHIIDTINIEFKIVNIYQWFDGLTSQSDLMLLLRGNIVGPIEWNEGERTLKFDVETHIRDREIGFSADGYDFTTNIPSVPFLDPNSADKAWPLCFGDVIHVPALRLKTSPTGHLKYPFKGPGAPNVIDPYNDPSHFYLQDGEGIYFPTGPVEVSIDGVIFSGSFSGDTFNVADNNLAKFYNIAFGPRGVMQPGLPTNPDPSTDPDLTNANVAWLESPISVVNNWVWIRLETGASSYLRVIRQEQNKIWFNTPVNVAGTSTTRLLGVGDSIMEVAKNGRPGWAITGTTTSLEMDEQQAAEVISKVIWSFNPGSEIRLWLPFHKDVYIANLIPSNSVVAVWAQRTNQSGVSELAPVPSYYYNINLNDVITVNNRDGVFNTTPTTITFEIPLWAYQSQGWTDQVYVTLRSSVGPNTADIISWLITTYSTLLPDSTSFTNVRALIDKYPSSFALFSKSNVMQTVDEIAWQARCALLVEDGGVFIRYLSKEPSADFTINETITELKSLQLAYTQTEDIVTRFEADYKLTYYPAPRFQRRIVSKTNVDLYGWREKVYNFYIYNISTLVQKSVTFWALRYANSWRLVRINSFLDVLSAELFDCISLNYADGSLLQGTFKSIVDKRYHDPKDDSINFELWLPSIAGTTIVMPGAWLDDSGDVKPGDPTLAYVPSVRDFQLADGFSKERVIFKSIGATVPAIVTANGPPPDTQDPSTIDESSSTSFSVDEYNQGFANAASASGVIATPVDPSNPPSIGDKVTVFEVNGRKFIQNSTPTTPPTPETRILGKITANNGGGLYHFDQWTSPIGVASGLTNIACREYHNTPVIEVGTFVSIEQFDSAYWFFYPIEACI